MKKKLVKTKCLDFSRSRILVVGDVMLDEYIIGAATRISPEAPVPVIKFSENKFNLGGAGNVAANLAALGVQATLIGLVGDDQQAVQVKKMARKQGIDGILLTTDQPTITKTRIVAQRQQIVRLDREVLFELKKNALITLIDTVCRMASSHDVVIVSDYAKGTVHPEMLTALVHHCKRLGIPVLADPKRADWRMYTGVTMLTPNLRELSENAGVEIANTDNDILREARKAIKNSGIEKLLITRSEKGMSFIDADQYQHIPAHAHEVFDVSGAGDTVIAVVAAALSANWSFDQAVKLANMAAGTVVLHAGTVPVNLEELIKSWNS